MNEVAAKNYSGACLSASSRQTYLKLERVISTPGFYMRETFIRAESQKYLQISPMYGLEKRLAPAIPQADSIASRIAPRQIPYTPKQTSKYVEPKKDSRPADVRTPKPKYQVQQLKVPNDFYLTIKDLQSAYGKLDDLAEVSLENDRDNNYRVLEKPMDSHACKRCGVPTILGRVCNNCIASLN